MQRVNSHRLGAFPVAPVSPVPACWAAWKRSGSVGLRSVSRANVSRVRGAGPVGVGWGCCLFLANVECFSSHLVLMDPSLSEAS